MSPAAAQDVSWRALSVNLDPMLIGAAGAIGLAVAAIAWAMRVSAASKTLSVTWSHRLAEMEARLEKADAVLSAHPGLVLVWEEDNDSADEGWGSPKILGGPAALASLLSLSNSTDALRSSPVNQLLDTLGDSPLEDDGPREDVKRLRDKVGELRTHGIAFSGSVVTSEGRAIEADGRVAGGQVALWLTDPAVRMAEDGGIMGKVRESATDLHGALKLLERSPIPAWRRGPEFNLLWVNKAYADAVEAPTPSVVIKNQIELDASVRKIAQKATTERRPVEGRVIVNIHGERRVMRVAEIPMHAAGEAALGGVAIDITDLDKARADLREYTESNRRTLDQIPSAVALFGGNQNLIYYNNAFQTLWGFDDADLNGNPSHGEILDKLGYLGRLPERANYDAWKTEQLALYTEGLSEPGSERDGKAPDETWNLPDGRTLKISRQRHPFGGVLVIFEDITEKLYLETRYNTQISVQRATLDNLSEGVAVFAADGSLRLYNTAFKNLWRLDRDLLADHPHIDKIAGALGQRLKDGGDQLADIKIRVTSMSPEGRAPIKGGELALRIGHTFSFGTEPLPDGATLLYFLDVTDSREREIELKERNAILEDADRLKSKFVGHVSYQLRTPLATVIGFSEMLDGQMFGVLNERQKDYIADILSASYHLRDLIDDVIDLAAIDAGKMTLDDTDVDVRDLLENATTHAALKAEDTQVAIRFDCAKDIGVIRADERRLKQVLFNLLSNAFAYTGSGGEVVLGADRKADMVRIWVLDTGRGVSAEDQAKAFDPFESRGPSAGAGLGLSLVERFIKLHGGWVRLDSKPGEGTRVTCYLPVRRRPAEEKNDHSTASLPPFMTPDDPPSPHQADASTEKPKAPQKKRTTRKRATTRRNSTANAAE